MNPNTAWRGFAWLVCLATLAHNTEELATMPSFYEQHMGSVLSKVDIPVATAVNGFRIVNIAVSVLAIALTAIGTLRHKPWLPALVAMTMLLNVVLPHVPTAIAVRGYSPGVVTAVLLITPVCGGFLWYLRRHAMLTTKALWGLAAASLGLIVLVLPPSLLLGSYLAR
jgi:hypothetical protein